jgi:hypothetical protein
VLLALPCSPANYRGMEAFLRDSQEQAIGASARAVAAALIGCPHSLRRVAATRGKSAAASWRSSPRRSRRCREPRQAYVPSGDRRFSHHGTARRARLWVIDALAGARLVGSLREARRAGMSWLAPLAALVVPRRVAAGDETQPVRTRSIAR